jgi:N-acetylglucosamine kinase-like BadF-type ATPase
MKRTDDGASRLAVGVDLGGTRLRIVALRDGAVAWRRAAHAIALPELSSVLPTLLQRDARGRRPRVAALVVAARGVWTSRERRVARRRLAPLAARVAVIPDVEAALLGALGDRPGVLVLAGTGSIVVGRDRRGRLVRAGGLGPLVGDEGSAFWVGREWLRTQDGGRGRWLATRPDAVRRIAALAPTVLARARGGDRQARAIVAAGQAALAALATRVAARLRLPAPVEVSWAGGLLADPWYRAGVRRALARRVVCRWRAPGADPAVAAARLAARMRDGR